VKKGEPLVVIPLKCGVYWKEYLSREDFTNGKIPATYPDEATVIKQGGTTRWANNVGPTFSLAMNIQMLIRRPEAITSYLFGVELPDGHVYAPAEIDVDKSAYNSVGPVLRNASKLSLHKLGLTAGVFEFATKSTVSKTGNATIIPTIKLVGFNSEEVVAQVAELCGQ